MNDIITITLPAWMGYLAIAGFFIQWILNVITAYYKNKCAKAYDRLDVATKELLKAKP